MGISGPDVKDSEKSQAVLIVVVETETAVLLVPKCSQFIIN